MPETLQQQSKRTTSKWKSYTSSTTGPENFLRLRLLGTSVKHHEATETRGLPGIYQDLISFQACFQSRLFPGFFKCFAKIWGIFAGYQVTFLAFRSVLPEMGLLSWILEVFAKIWGIFAGCQVTFLAFRSVLPEMGLLSWIFEMFCQDLG